MPSYTDTAAPGTNTTQIATTAFVQAAGGTPGGDLGGASLGAAVVLKASTTFGLSSAIQSPGVGNNVVIGTTGTNFEYSIGNSNFTITGFDATGSAHGRRIVITVRPSAGSTGTLTLSNQNVLSSANNRIETGGILTIVSANLDILLTPGGSVELQYITDGGGSNRWRVIGTSSPGVGGDIRTPLCSAVVWRATQDFTFFGQANIAQLTASVNDLSISNSATVFLTASDASGPWNMTGIAAGTSLSGRALFLYVRNDQPNGVNLVENSGLSIAGNRFFLGGMGTYYLSVGSMVQLQFRQDGAAAVNGWYLVTAANARQALRVVSVPDATPVNIDSDVTDWAVMDAISQPTTINAPTGVPTNLQFLGIRITCASATGQALTWNSIFRGGPGLPTPPIASGPNLTTYFKFYWNAAVSKWDWWTGHQPSGSNARSVVTLTDAATVTVNSDITSVGLLLTLGQATQFLNPSGTPGDAQQLELRIKSTTARALTWDTQFRGCVSTALPTTTSGASLTDRFWFEWNSADSKWDFTEASYGWA